MNDYEDIVISAERYALGRMTYIVELTVNYILKEIEENKLSKQCLTIIKRDIEKATSYGMKCDKEQWIRLLTKIDEVI